MTKEQADVKSWMQKFGQETPDKPTIPSLEIRKLRAKLILEEALETILALGFNVEVRHEPIENRLYEPCIHGQTEPCLLCIADGLADLHYVAYCGTAVACGIDMEPVFEEVHRSNMSKLWTSAEWLNTETKYMNGSEVSPNKWLVTRSDGKVIKSPSYSPANIKL